jgi:hypothetical protein
VKGFRVLSPIASGGGGDSDFSELIVKSERARYCSDMSEEELESKVLAMSASCSACQTPPDSTESKGGAGVSKYRVCSEAESQGEGLEAPEP